METVKVDNRKRVRIPDAKPGQVFALDNRGDGTFLLTVVRAEAREPFPEGSLKKYWTREKNAQEMAILRDCIQGPPADE